MFLWSADCGPRAGERGVRNSDVALRDTDHSGGGSQFCSCVLKCVVFSQIVRSWVICLSLRMLVDALKRLSVSESLVSSLWFRYFSPASWGERESVLSDSEAGLGRGIMDNPFLGLLGTRKQRGLKGWPSIYVLNPHLIKNTILCYSSWIFWSF